MSYIKEPMYSMSSNNVRPNLCFEDMQDITRRNFYCVRNCHQQECLSSRNRRHCNFCNYHSYTTTSDYNSCSDDYVLECVEEDREYILKLYLQEGYRHKFHGHQCHHQPQLQSKQFDYNILQNINRCNQIGQYRSVQNSISSASEDYSDDQEDDEISLDKQCRLQDENQEKDYLRHIHIQADECQENKRRPEVIPCRSCQNHRCCHCCIIYSHANEQCDESDTFSQTSAEHMRQCEKICPHCHQHEHHHQHHHHHHYYCDHNHKYYIQPHKQPQYSYQNYCAENQFGKENIKCQVYENAKKPDKYSENSCLNENCYETHVQPKQKPQMKDKDKNQDNIQESKQKTEADEKQRLEDKSETKIKEKYQHKVQADDRLGKKTHQLQQEKSNKNNEKNIPQQQVNQKPKKQKLQQHPEDDSRKQRQITQSKQLSKQQKQKYTPNNSTQDNITLNKKSMQGGRLLKRENKMKQIEKQPTNRKAPIKQPKKQPAEREQNSKKITSEITGQNLRAKKKQIQRKAQQSESLTNKECSMNKECSVCKSCSLIKGCSVNKECPFNKECSINKECDDRSPKTSHRKCQQMVYRLNYCKTHFPYQNSILIKL